MCHTFKGSKTREIKSQAKKIQSQQGTIQGIQTTVDSFLSCTTDNLSL